MVSKGFLLSIGLLENAFLSLFKLLPRASFMNKIRYFCFSAQFSSSRSWTRIKTTCAKKRVLRDLLLFYFFKFELHILTSHNC